MTPTPRLATFDELETLPPGVYILDEQPLEPYTGEKVYEPLSDRYVMARFTGRRFARVRETGELPRCADLSWIRKSDGRAVVICREIEDFEACASQEAE